MSAVSAALAALERAEAEIASAPDVWFVLVKYDTRGLRECEMLNPLYAVQLPQDLGRFRLRDDRDVMFKFRGRWYEVIGAWRQLKKPNLDAAENRPCAVTSFGCRILKGMGVKEWKP